MRYLAATLTAATRLDADLHRLRHDHLVTVELDELIDLVRDPEVDPLVPRHGPALAGVDDLAATLTAATRLPGELTVRVVRPAEPSPDGSSVADIEAALHRRVAYQASVSWREGMAQRSMGLRQIPWG